MNIFMLSTTSLMDLRCAIQDRINERGVPIWMDAAVGRDYGDQLKEWMRHADLIVILANKEYFACKTQQAEWEVAAESNLPKLVVRLEDVELPALTSSFVVKNCESAEAVPDVIFEYLEQKTRAKLFVSYSRDDLKAKDTLLGMIRASLCQPWVDESGIKPGDEFPDRILQAIDDCDCFLLLWSINSRNSRWVEREWNHAFKHDKAIIPLLLDSTPLPMVLARVHSFESLNDPALYDFLEIPAP